MALPPDDKKKTADKLTQDTPANRTTPPPLKSPAYSDARKAAIAQAAGRQTTTGATAGIENTTTPAPDPNPNDRFWCRLDRGEQHGRRQDTCSTRQQSGTW